jgi:serine/threonine protein kinase
MPRQINRPPKLKFTPQAQSVTQLQSRAESPLTDQEVSELSTADFLKKTLSFLEENPSTKNITFTKMHKDTSEITFHKKSKEKRVVKIKLSTQLGSGSFGTVYTCEIIEKAVKSLLAIKVCSVEESINHLKEIKKHQKLSDTLQHPAIVPFIGKIPHEYAFLIPLYSLGSLANWIDLNKTKTQDDEAYFSKVSNFIVKDITEGAAQLSIKKYIHFDLTVHNIFLHGDEENPHAVIGDFGCLHSRTDDDINFLETGTFSIKPPESFSTKKTSKDNCKIDEWAIGLLIKSLLYLEPPTPAEDPSDCCLLARHETFCNWAIDYDKTFLSYIREENQRITDASVKIAFITLNILANNLLSPATFRPAASQLVKLDINWESKLANTVKKLSEKPFIDKDIEPQEAASRYEL